MRQVQTYGKGSSEIYGEADVAKNAKDDVKTLWIVTSSDRGLCGGIHSAVSKKAKKEIALSSNHSDDRIVILGEKPKAQISRSMPDNIVLSVSQIGRAVPTFQEACAIAEKIEEANVEYDKVNLIYNAVISPIAYEPTVLEVFSTDQLRGAAGFNSYEVEDDGLIGDLTSFSLANAIFTALVEGHAAEISARRNAMDNASKNVRFPHLLMRTSIVESMHRPARWCLMILTVSELRIDRARRWASSLWNLTAGARQPSQMTLWTSLQVNSPAPARCARD